MGYVDGLYGLAITWHAMGQLCLIRGVLTEIEPVSTQFMMKLLQKTTAKTILSIT